MRPGEVEGKDYIFVDTDTFQNMIKKREFLEHAKVFDNYYGTPRGPVETSLKAGKDVLFDVDWQGTHTRKFRRQTSPPSLAFTTRSAHTPPSWGMK